MKVTKNRVSPDTEGEAEALTKTLKTQANSLLAGADPLTAEIKR